MTLGSVGYAWLLATLLGLGALGLETVLRWAGRPTRVVWLVALLLSAVLPLTLLAFAAAPASAAPGTVPTPGGPWDILAGAARLPLGTSAALAWAGMSTAALAGLTLLAWRMRVRARRWPRAVVDGVGVRVSSATGPLVMGLGGPSSCIVLPRWVLDLDPPARSMIVAHEQEHLCAGDLRLLWAGLLTVAAVPWNPPLWWQLRRLGLAVEMDCDRRVVGATGDGPAYGRVLLETGRILSGAPYGVLPWGRRAAGLRLRIAALGGRGRPRGRAALAGAVGLLAALATVAAVPRPPSAEHVGVEPPLPPVRVQVATHAVGGVGDALRAGREGPGLRLRALRWPSLTRIDRSPGAVR